MCAVDDAEPWAFSHQETRTARKVHRCDECGREIAAGELYEHLTGVFDGHWSTFRWCRHCDAAGQWMNHVCGGWMLGNLDEELVEHWREGFTSIGFARLIVGMKLRWHGGRDQVPTGVDALAGQMLRAQVAA